MKNGQQIQTLDVSHEGPQHVSVSGSAPNFHIQESTITTADVIADNGVIQVIDNVLVPSNINIPQRDVLHTAIATPQLSTLVKAVLAAGLSQALAQPNGPYTVFAPTDAAFAAVPARILDCLLRNPKALSEVLLFHVAKGYTYSEQIVNGTTVPTLSGKPITLNVAGDLVLINYGAGFPTSTVILSNVDTNNGVVHVIDRVLFDNTGACKQ